MDNDESVEQPSKQKKSRMKETDFIKFLQLHPCLLAKSQTPDMKRKKQLALEAMEKSIEKNHNVQMNTSQIRKKIENMKARVKSRGERRKAGNYRRLLKDHEKQLLDLIDCTNKSVSNKTQDSEQWVMPDTSNHPEEEEHIVFIKEEEPSRPSSSTTQLRECSSPTNTMIDLKKDILIETKELNRQKRELNIQQKEIFALQKEKLLLEIEFLKNKNNILKLL